jgi:hypothetical protein
VEKTSISELQFADDAAIVAGSKEDLQKVVEILLGTYADFGMEVNFDRTRVMFQTIETGNAT